MTQSVLRTTEDRGSSVASGQSVFNDLTPLSTTQKEQKPSSRLTTQKLRTLLLTQLYRAQSTLENITTHTEINSNIFPVVILYSTDALADSNLQNQNIRVLNIRVFNIRLNFFLISLFLFLLIQFSFLYLNMMLYITVTQSYNKEKQL